MRLRTLRSTRLLKWRYFRPGFPVMDQATDGTGASGGGVGAPAATPAAGQPVAMTQQQLQQLAGPLTQHIQQSLNTALQPIQQQVQALNTRMDQLSAPRQNASQLFGGGAPAVQTGESALSSRGFQYWRVIGYRQGNLPADQCKVELSLHQRLHQLYYGQGGMVLAGTNSILVPMGTQSLMYDAALPNSPIEQNLITEVRQMLGAGIMGFDMDRAQWLRQSMGGLQLHPQYHGQALSQYDDTGLGVFLGPTQRGELIELLRNREVFSRVGATQMSLPPNGRLQFDKQTGATTAGWIGETPSGASTPAMSASAPTTGSMTLMAKKQYVLCKIPNELIRFATPEVEAFIRNDMVRVLALGADSSMLEGTPNGNRIKGLITYDGIQTHVAGTVATDGNTLEPEDIGTMLAKLEDANHELEDGSTAWVMRSLMMNNIENRRAAAHTAGVYDGPFLFPMNRDDMTKGMVSRLRGYQVVKSSQVSNARAKGASTDLTYVLAGVFRHWIIGRVGVMEFATTTTGDTPFITDQTWVRAIQHIDAGPRYENAFIMCDTIDMDLP